MKIIKKQGDLLIELSAALLILLFVYTASSKLITRPAFADVLGQSPLIGERAYFISWLVPLTEIIISMLLLWPATRLIGFYASLSVLILFTGYIALMIKFSSHLPCSCGGVIQLLSWKQHLFFNLIFILISAAGVVLQGRPAINKLPNRVMGHSA